MILGLAFIGFVLVFIVPELVPRHNIFSSLRKKYYSTPFRERYTYPKK